MPNELMWELPRTKREEGKNSVIHFALTSTSVTVDDRSYLAQLSRIILYKDFFEGKKLWRCDLIDHRAPQMVHRKAIIFQLYLRQ